MLEIPYKSLIYFGNDCLNNKYIQTLSMTQVSSPSNSVQAIPNPRNFGSTVVNTKLEAKTITITGGITNGSTSLSIEDLHDRLKKSLNKKDRWFRVVPESYEIGNYTTTTGWVASGDSNTLTSNTNNLIDKDELSIQFNVTINTGVATLTYTPSSPLDLSTYLTDDYSVNFGVNITDVYGLLSITFSFVDGANKYETTVISNYENLPFENGWNLISIPFDQFTQTGTVVKTSIDSFVIKLNFDIGNAVNQSAILLSKPKFVKEDRVRNYPCYQEGLVDMPEQWGENEIQISFSASFLNYTGYAVSTHAYEAFNVTGITSITSTQTVNFGGTVNPLPSQTLKLNTTTNLTDLRITNINNQETIQFTNTWTNGDVVNLSLGELQKANVTRNGDSQDCGKLPTYNTGIQRIQLNVVQGTSTIIENTTSLNQSEGTYTYYAQSFVASATGTATTCRFYLQNIGSPRYSGFMRIVPNNSGNPNTGYVGGGPSYEVALTLSNYYIVSGNIGYYEAIINRPLTSGTTYWIYTRSINSSGNGFTGYGTSTSSYASGVAKYSNNGSSWSTGLVSDYGFYIEIEPIPSTNIDWSMTYHKLYL